MKRIITLCLLTIVIISCSVPAFASEQELIVWHQESTLENGITIIDEVINNSLTRSSTRDYTRRRTISDDGVTIAVISVRGVFSYNGTTVSVVSKSVTQTDTYEGWSYKQNSFTSSGGTIALDAKLTKLLVMNIPFTITLSCDKNGNISYT